MLKRREALALSVAAVLVVSVAVRAQKKEKDDKKASEKQTEAQRKEYLDIIRIVDSAAAGQVPNDVALSWVREDFLKATGNKEYVPFTVSVDTSKVSGPTVQFYWRVVDKNPPASITLTPPPPAGKDDKKKDDKKDDKKAAAPPPPPLYAYEGLAAVPVTPGTQRISRSFTVPAGSYDVTIVVKEPLSSMKNATTLPKASLIKQAVTVPDFWNSEFTTSSVIVAQRIEPVAATLSDKEQLERPYALGGMEIIPVTDTNFTKKAELSTFMLIYNAKLDAMKKPDVVVEYNFYAKPAGAPEKFFNKTAPQNLNAQTLPPQFDVEAGHQLQTGQAVPLASFPEGDYRLEIKVTDKLANKTLTRDLTFTVTAG